VHNSAATIAVLNETKKRIRHLPADHPAPFFMSFLQSVEIYFWVALVLAVISLIGSLWSVYQSVTLFRSGNGNSIASALQESMWGFSKEKWVWGTMGLSGVSFLLAVLQMALFGYHEALGGLNITSSILSIGSGTLLLRAKQAPSGDQAVESGKEATAAAGQGAATSAGVLGSSVVVAVVVAGLIFVNAGATIAVDAVAVSKILNGTRTSSGSSGNTGVSGLGFACTGGLSDSCCRALLSFDSNAVKSCGEASRIVSTMDSNQKIAMGNCMNLKRCPLTVNPATCQSTSSVFATCLKGLGAQGSCLYSCYASPDGEACAAAYKRLEDNC
jgi:hypothetical protein